MFPFHLAIAVSDLQATKSFYTEVLGCKVGRATDKWIDFDFYGHQLSAHLKPDEISDVQKNLVDGKQVPVKHFGLVLSWDKWHELRDVLTALNTSFIIEPYIRFKGQIGEQATMFFCDPSGNAIELKSFKQPDQLFVC